MSINKSILTGFSWTGLQIIIDRGLGIVVKLILARILFPEDFGLIGMAAVFLSIVQVFYELGFGAALIQKEGEVSDLEFNTAFWATLLWSLVLYGLLFLGAPLIAAFYEQPILTDIVRVLGLGILTLPINLIQRVQMNRALRFKQLAIINNVSNLIGAGLAIIGALYGLGVWALVIQAVLPRILRIPLYYFYGAWSPKKLFSFEIFKSIGRFGIFTTASDLLNKVIAQADYLLVGKLLGAYELGIYTFAFLLTAVLRNQIVIVINRVMFPIYSKFQHDKKKLKLYYLRIVELISFVMFPVFTILLLFSQDMIAWLFPKWIEAVPLVQIFVIGVLINTVANPFGAFIRGVGKPELQVKVQAFRAVIYLSAILLGYYWLGLEGVAWAFVITAILVSGSVIFLMQKMYDIRVIDLLKSLRIPGMTLLLMLIVGATLTYYTDSIFIRLGGVLLILVLLYGRSLKSYMQILSTLRKS